MKKILSFTLGAAIGALVSWVYHKNKYEEMVQQEIKSLRKYSENKSNEVETTKLDNTKNDAPNISYVNENEDLGKANTIINYCGYSNDDYDHTELKELKEKYTKPFIITPEAFGTMIGFDTDTYYYYKDDVIANGDQVKVEFVESVFGLPTDEIKKHFGIYEDSAVYIRNMQLECDYEILIEEENFYDEE